MQIEGKKILIRLKDKNRGNAQLCRAIDQLILDCESANLNRIEDFKLLRSDAEKVHSGGFFFVNLHIHRTLLLLMIESKEVIVVWAGNHNEYERTFKNNKTSIEKWLRKNNLLP
jgi:hypothetical protein